MAKIIALKLILERKCAVMATSEENINEVKS
jgi:hypothetical protein